MRRALLVVAVVMVLIAGIGIYVAINRFGHQLPIPILRGCEARTDTGSVKLNADQMANAATIAAVGLTRGLPDRAVVVALATAMQESELTNLAGGDRDSVGLFQQRPSQGWGTVEQIRDPRYAASAFYNQLVKVRGWEEMRVTEAAQLVQRSAFPEAYQAWADEAQVLGDALVGDRVRCGDVQPRSASRTLRGRPRPRRSAPACGPTGATWVRSRTAEIVLVAGRGPDRLAVRPLARRPFHRDGVPGSASATRSGPPRAAHGARSRQRRPRPPANVIAEVYGS